MPRLVALLTSALTLTGALAATPASAQVLVDRPARHLTTSGCITLGIWYQAYSGGSRTVTVSVRHHGRIKARRTLRATSRWRNYLLACPGYPNAGRWYTTVKGSGWHTTFVTRVVIDRD